MKGIMLNVVVGVILAGGAILLIGRPAEAHECYWCEHCLVTPSGARCGGGHWCCI